jgi:hypothetical protein
MSVPTMTSRRTPVADATSASFTSSSAPGRSIALLTRSRLETAIGESHDPGRTGDDQRVVGHREGRLRSTQHLRLLQLLSELFGLAVLQRDDGNLDLLLTGPQAGRLAAKQIGVSQGADGIAGRQGLGTPQNAVEERSLHCGTSQARVEFTQVVINLAQFLSYLIPKAREYREAGDKEDHFPDLLSRQSRGPRTVRTAENSEVSPVSRLVAVAESTSCPAGTGARPVAAKVASGVPGLVMTEEPSGEETR